MSGARRHAFSTADLPPKEGHVRPLAGPATQCHLFRDAPIPDLSWTIDPDSLLAADLDSLVTRRFQEKTAAPNRCVSSPENATVPQFARAMTRRVMAPRGCILGASYLGWHARPPVACPAQGGYVFSVLAYQEGIQGVDGLPVTLVEARFQPHQAGFRESDAIALPPGPTHPGGCHGRLGGDNGPSTWKTSSYKHARVFHGRHHGAFRRTD